MERKFFDTFVKESYANHIGKLITKEELENFSVLELVSIGFRIYKYDKEKNKTLMFIPIKLLYCLNQEDLYHSIIDVDKQYKLKSIDKDTRFGCLAYGLWIDNKTESSQRTRHSRITQRLLDEIEYQE